MNKSADGMTPPTEVPNSWPFPTYKGVSLRQVKNRDTLAHVPDFNKPDSKVGDTNDEEEATF